MLILNDYNLSRCPQCGIASPRLTQIVNDYVSDESGFWEIYQCATCDNYIMANRKDDAVQVFPNDRSKVSPNLPARAAEYLVQALASAPAGAVMLAASAVDAMLRAKGYKEGNLFSRIDKAEVDRIITPEMKEWAHEVRLDANEQRHPNEDEPLPTKTDADRSIRFAQALTEYLFDLPAMVKQGRAKRN